MKQRNPRALSTGLTAAVSSLGNMALRGLDIISSMENLVAEQPPAMHFTATRQPRGNGKMEKTLMSLHRQINRSEAQSRMREMRGENPCRVFPSYGKKARLRAEQAGEK